MQHQEIHSILLACASEAALREVGFVAQVFISLLASYFMLLKDHRLSLLSLHPPFLKHSSLLC